MGKLDFDKGKVKKVAITDVRVNSWNPKKSDTPEFEKIKKGIQLKGLRGALIVRDNPKDNVTYEIIDGHQRFTAADQLGFKEVYIYDEGKMSDKEAKELTVWYQQQVPFDRVAEAYMINELVLEFPDDIELPYTEVELDELKELAGFDFSKYDDSEGDYEDSENARVIRIVTTLEQYNVVMLALAKVKNMDENVTDGMAIERISADFLAGN